MILTNSMRRDGFTLIELLLVIANIGVLAGIVIMAINPSAQLVTATDAKRRASAKAMASAIQQYIIDTGQFPGNVDIPIGRQNAVPICRKGASGSCANMNVLTEGETTGRHYISDIFVDPAETNPNLSGLGVYVDGPQVQVIPFHLGKSTTPAVFGSQLYGSTITDMGLAGILRHPDGGYILGGYVMASNGDVTDTTNGSYDYWLAKLAADGEVEWDRAFGGSGLDYPYSIIQTTDGGYLLSGQTDSTNGDISGGEYISGSFSYNYWIVKVNSTGQLEWENDVGGVLQGSGGTGQEQAFGAIQASDGSFIIIGRGSSSASGDFSGTNYSSNNHDWWIVKLLGDGSLAWETNLGGTSYDAPYGIVEMEDGSFLIAGDINTPGGGNFTGSIYGQTDVWVVNMSSDGDIIWQQNYGGSGTDSAQQLIPTSDGNYVFVANSGSSANGDVSDSGNGGYDVWIVKITPAGAIVWDTLVGGTGTDWVTDIVEAYDGSFYITGYTDSLAPGGDMAGPFHGGREGWVLKVDSDGNLLWEKVVGGDDNDELRHLTLTSDGGFIATGYAASSNTGDVHDVNRNPGTNDIWVVKFDEDGNIETQN